MENIIFVDKKNWDYKLVYETEFNSRHRKESYAWDMDPLGLEG